MEDKTKLYEAVGHYHVAYGRTRQEAIRRAKGSYTPNVKVTIRRTTGWSQEAVELLVERNQLDKS